MTIKMTPKMTIEDDLNLIALMVDQLPQDELQKFHDHIQSIFDIGDPRAILARKLTPLKQLEHEADQALTKPMTVTLH